MVIFAGGKKVDRSKWSLAEDLSWCEVCANVNYDPDDYNDRGS